MTIRTVILSIVAGFPPAWPGLRFSLTDLIGLGLPAYPLYSRKPAGFARFVLGLARHPITDELIGPVLAVTFPTPANVPSITGII